MSDQFQFQYDSKESFDTNYTKWRQMNIEERSAWSEPQLTDDEASILLSKLFGQYKLQGTK